VGKSIDRKPPALLNWKTKRSLNATSSRWGSHCLGNNRLGKTERLPSEEKPLLLEVEPLLLEVEPLLLEEEPLLLEEEPLLLEHLLLEEADLLQYHQDHQDHLLLEEAEFLLLEEDHLKVDPPPVFSTQRKAKKRPRSE
jgi:hypothetical protein